MAFTITSLYAMANAVAEQNVDLSSTNFDATGVVVFVKATVTAGAGGNIPASLLGIKTITGGVAGGTTSGVATVDVSGNQITTTNTNGTYGFIVYGIGLGQAKNS